MISAGTVTFDYDARGNLWHRTSGSNVTTYTLRRAQGGAYNAADQLTNVTATGLNATYAYDADGRRVKQTIGSAVTNYLWDEASPYGDVVLETDASNAVLARYVLGGTELISQTRSGSTNYYLQDGQGSTRALTNTNTPATVTDTYSYTAFGELLNHTGTTVNPYQYTGQQFDSLTSLYDLRARYYNPALGRFLSQDTYPIDFGNPIELNRYVYATNSPINRTDPTGNTSIPEYGILLAGVAGGAAGAISALACGRNALEGFIIGAALGLTFGAGFAALYAASPGLAVTGGLVLSGSAATISVYDFFAHGMTLCKGTNAALSLIFFGLAAWGGINYLGNKYLGRLGEFGVPDEFLPPSATGQWMNWVNAESVNSRMPVGITRYTQSHVNPVGNIVEDGQIVGKYTIEENVQQLKTDPNFDLPPIRIFRMESYMRGWGQMRNPKNPNLIGDPKKLQVGQIYSLDNRRLLTYRLAGRSTIPVRWVDPPEVYRWRFEFTTENFGLTIEILPLR